VFNNRRVKTLKINTPQPSAAFLRIAQIIGNPDAIPPIPALIPIGKSTWWQWVRDGKAPPSVKLGPRTTAWKSADISALIDSLNATKTGGL
jgi:prophage regulatory protein